MEKLIPDAEWDESIKELSRKLKAYEIDDHEYYREVNLLREFLKKRNHAAKSTMESD